MPKIDAPTVAEHRARQQAAIVAAAREALRHDGVSGVTPGAVARAAGLARTSVYQYFPSTEALVTAAVEDLFSRAGARLRDALGDARDPWACIDAYVDVALTAASGGYGPFHGMTGAELPETTRTRMREMREELAAPLVEALGALGVAVPSAAAAMVFGTVGAAVTLLGHGAPAAEIRRTCRAMVLGGVRACLPAAGDAA